MKPDFKGGYEPRISSSTWNRILEEIKDKGIIVDAYQGKKEPGNIHVVRLNLDELDRYTDDFNLSLHDLKFIDALKSGKHAYRLPQEIILIGVEPERLEPTMELSPRLRKAVPEIIKKIEEIIYGEVP